MTKFEHLKARGFVQEHNSPGSNELCFTLGNIYIYVSDEQGNASPEAINNAQRLLISFNSFDPDHGDDCHGVCELKSI